MTGLQDFVQVQDPFSEYKEDACVICKQGPASEKLISMRSDGKATLANYCVMRGDFALSQYLATDPRVVCVHNSCRRMFTYHSNLPSEPMDASASCEKNLRSVSVSFDYHSDCVLCCKPIRKPTQALGKQSADSYREVHSKDKIHSTIMQICEFRKDVWGLEVVSRLHTCVDLRAADARYHVRCYLHFSTGRQKPSLSTSGLGVGVRHKGGRPADSEMLALFDAVCDWMESGDCELFTIGQLHEKMVEMAFNPQNVYDPGYIKKLLQKRYGDHIWFASVCGKKDVICFRDMASRIVNDLWYVEREDDLIGKVNAL